MDTMVSGCPKAEVPVQAYEGDHHTYLALVKSLSITNKNTP